MEKKLRIGELAKQSGVAVQTIRFYEMQGLLPAPLRLENNYRNYTQKHLARLHFIRHCRLLDMSLEEIDKLIKLEKSASQDFSVVHETISAHIHGIEQRIEQLTELKQRLQALECHCTGDHEDCSCGILRELESYADSCEDCQSCREFEQGCACSRYDQKIK